MNALPCLMLLAATAGTPGGVMIGYFLIGGFALYTLVLFVSYLRKAARGERW